MYTLDNFRLQIRTIGGYRCTSGTTPGDSFAASVHCCSVRDGILDIVNRLEDISVEDTENTLINLADDMGPFIEAKGEFNVYLDYSLKECEQVPPQWVKDYNYIGDADVLEGGTFWDLRTRQYTSVYPLERKEWIAVEHMFVCTQRWQWILKEGQWVRGKDYWKEALAGEPCHSRLHLYDVLQSYGRTDPDDSWANYTKPWQVVAVIGNRVDVPEPQWLPPGCTTKRFVSEREFLLWLMVDQLGYLQKQGSVHHTKRVVEN